MTVREPEPFCGSQWKHPDGQLGSPGIYYQPAMPASRKRPAKPPEVRLTGPLGGALVCDVERLRYEGQRLLDAADTLEVLIDREPMVDVEGQGLLL